MVFLLLNIFSLPGQALNSFESHILSASQGMAAFHMYLLTEGDEKYIRQFNRYQKSAESSLDDLDLSKFSALSNDWREFVSKLEYQVLDNHSIFFETYARNEYRSYLTNLYLKYVEQNKGRQLNAENAIIRVQILSTILAARALDVASDIYGSTVLTEEDNQLSPKIISHQIQVDIDYLLNQTLTAYQKTILRKASSKFHFIKKNMVDYKAQTAYFLIYGNMRAMNKLFSRQFSKAIAINEH